MEPFAGIRSRGQRLFIFIGIFRPQPWPVIVRTGNILHRMGLPYRVRRPEVKGSKVNGFVGGIIHAVKSDAYETVLDYILTFYIKLNNPCRKFLPAKPRDPFPVYFIQMDTPRVWPRC